MAFPTRINGIEFQSFPLQSSDDYFESFSQLSSWQTFDHYSITSQFISEMRAFLNDPTTMMTFRSQPTDFTRDPCFTFPRLAIAIIKEHARPSQDRIVNLFKEGAFGKRKSCPTASAFCQDRVKLDPAFYKTWMAKAVQFYYIRFPQEHLVTTWHGHYVWAIDCSNLTLPDTDETRATFRVNTNPAHGSVTVQGKASFAYDVLNDIPINALLGNPKDEKQLFINSHAQYLSPSVIVLFDRGYTSYDVIATTLVMGANFVIRFPKSHNFSAVEVFMNGDVMEQFVTIQVPHEKKRLAIECGWPLEVRVRLVRIVLENGTVEVLMTSLLDRDEYTISDLNWLYGKRWNVESGFFRFKQLLYAEKFSSKKLLNIEQDFYALVFMQTIESIMDKDQDHEMLVKSQEKHLKHEYHVNKAHACASLFGHLVDLFLLDEQTMENHLLSLQQEMRLSKSVIRPGRHNPRRKLNQTERVRYMQYRMKFR
jgi:hypothetical protein